MYDVAVLKKSETEENEGGLREYSPMKAIMIFTLRISISSIKTIAYQNPFFPSSLCFFQT